MKNMKKELRNAIVNEILFNGAESIRAIQLTIINKKIETDFKSFRIINGLLEKGNDKNNYVKNCRSKGINIQNINSNSGIISFNDKLINRNNNSKFDSYSSIQYYFKDDALIISSDTTVRNSKTPNISTKYYTDAKSLSLVEDRYYIYIIFVKSFMNPIIRISAEETNNFFDLYNNDFLIDTYGNQIHEIKIIESQYNLESIKNRTEAIYSFSSLSKEYIEYDEDDDVIKYHNYMNQVQVDCTNERNQYLKIGDVLIESIKVNENEKYLEFINFYFFIGRILYRRIDKATKDVTYITVRKNFEKNKIIFDKAKRKIDDLDLSRSIEDITAYIEKFMSSADYIEIQDEKEIDNYDFIIESLSNYINIISNIYKRGETSNYNFDNNRYIINFSNTKDNKDISELTIIDKDVNNVIIKFIYNEDVDYATFASISGIQFSYSGKRSYSDNDVIYEISNIDSRGRYILKSFDSIIYSSYKNLYRRNMFGMPVRIGKGIFK